MKKNRCQIYFVLFTKMDQRNISTTFSEKSKIKKRKNPMTTKSTSKISCFFVLCLNVYIFVCFVFFRTTICFYKQKWGFDQHLRYSFKPLRGPPRQQPDHRRKKERERYEVCKSLKRNIKRFKRRGV